MKIFKKLITLLLMIFAFNSTSIFAKPTDDVLVQKVLRNGKIVETSSNLMDLANQLGNYETVTYEVTEEMPSARTNDAESNFEQTKVTYFIEKSLARGNGSNNYNEDILSHAFNIYSTIEYTTSKDSNNINFVRLNKVSGGINRYENTWTIYSQTIRYGCVGNRAGHPFDESQVIEIEIGAKNSYSYTVPSTWVAVSVNDDAYTIGVNHFWKIGRINGAIYNGEVQNHY